MNKAMNEKQKQITTTETTNSLNPPNPKEQGAAQADADGIKRYKEAVQEALDREYCEFLYSQSMGSWKYWIWADQIASEVGLSEEQQTAAQKEVYDEFGKEADPSKWNIFLHGTPEERRALQAEIAFDLYGPEPDEEPRA
jgi:hypothetical protein